jgi:Lrp/AsnC family transcriptional regulator, leucine-responsive regulatory protein
VIDAIDRSLLEILKRDGRTPAAQIAEQVGLSRPAVAERIEKLRNEGVLLGTTAVVDPVALGQGVTAFISARRAGSLDPRSRKMFRELMERQEILEAHSVAGEDCYLLKVRTDSIESLNRIVVEMTTPPLALSTRTTIVMATHCEKVGGVVTWGDLDEA